MPPPLRHDFTSADAEIIKSDTTHDGYFKIKRHILRHRLFNGEWSNEMAREVFYSGPAVTLLPYDPVLDAVLLIEQFRIATHVTTSAPWLIEVIAGRVEPGETASQTVVREAREEAGLIIRDLTPIASLYPAPGYADEILHHFCARADLSQAGGIHGLDTEEEDIRALVMPFEEALAAVTSGEIITAPAATSLYWLALNRDDLRNRWVA